MMKQSFKRVLASITVLTFILSVTVNAAVDTSLPYTDYEADTTAELNAFTDLVYRQAGDGACEVDVQIIDPANGNLVFTAESNTVGTVTATPDSGYELSQFRYYVVENEDGNDIGFDLNNGIYDPDKDYMGKGFAVDVTEDVPALKLGIEVIRNSEENVPAHKEPEFIVVVTADFEKEQAEVTIDPTIYLYDELTGTMSEQPAAGYMILSNIVGATETVIDSNNTGAVVNTTADVGSKIEFEAVANTPLYKFIGWKADVDAGIMDPEDASAKGNPRDRDVVSGSNTFTPNAVFVAVPQEPDTVMVTGETDHSDVTISGLGAKVVGTDAPISVSASGNRIISTVRAYFWGIIEEPQEEETDGPVRVSELDYEPAMGWIHYPSFDDSTSFTIPKIETDWNIVVTSYEKETPPPPPPATNYTLTVNVVGEGSVPGFEGTNTFSSGTNVNLQAVLDSGSEMVFAGWSGDASGTDEATVVVMNGNKVVTATFEAEEEPVEPEEPEEEILDPIIPESAPEEEIPDEALPETGGIPMEAMSMMGLAVSGLGVALRRKRR